MDTANQRFGPKSSIHPSILKPCPACNRKFKVGDYTTLVVLGPGNSKENQKKARNGQAYNAIAVEVHWPCATGLAEGR